MATSDHWFLPPDPKGEFSFEVQSYLFNLLVAVKEARDDEVERLLKPLGLSRQQYRVLLTVQRLQPCAMNELALMTCIDRTTLTRCLDRLCRQGFVERRADSVDRRLVILTVPPLGLRKVGAAQAVVDALGRRALADIPEEIQRSTVVGLRALPGQFGTTLQDMRKLFDARSGVDGV